MAVLVAEFGAVAIEANGKSTLIVGEPAIRTTVVTPTTVTRHVTVTASTRFVGIWPSSGGDAFWYNCFVSTPGLAVNTATMVVSPGFPERFITLSREGDYEMFGVGPMTTIGIRGS